MANPGAARGPVTPPDADVRADVVASAGKTMLVEAAAGTGKTTLLVDRVLQGVREGGMRLAGTVAITFTEKAAGELEERLRAAFAGSLHATGLTEEERRHIRTALGEIDHAAIGTIHAFCARLLREKPAEAGVDPEFAVIEPAAAEVLRERCWREWIDEQVAGRPGPLVEALRAEVPVARLKELAFAFLDTPEVLEGGRFALPRPEQGVDDLVAELIERAPAARDLFGGMGRSNKHARAFAHVTADLAECASSDPAAVRRLAYQAAALPADTAFKSIAKAAGDEGEAVLLGFHTVAAALGGHLAADVFQWLADFVRHYGQAKQTRALLDFQDLLWLSAQMLRQDLSVRRFFQRRFGAFLVDEFQDTDPLQADVVAFLCEDPQGPPAVRMEDVRLADGKLFAVGDPKQSIYRFRRADVQIYERFKRLFGAEAFGEDRTRRVSCNFRSTPSLLAFGNSAYAELFVPPQDARVYQAAHVLLLAPPEAEPGIGPPVLGVCPPESLHDPKRTAPPARRLEAAFVARTIRAIVGGRLPGYEGGEFCYSDFAVLSRALTDVDVYLNALDAEGIPYRLLGGAGFYQREHVAETLTLLEAVDDPLNEAAVVGTLRSSFFGLSDEDLLRHREEGGVWDYQVDAAGAPAVREALAQLAEWHGRRNRVPAAQLLNEVLASTRVIQAFRLKPAGEQRAADIGLMLDRLRDLAAAAPTFSAAVRYLGAMRDGQRGEQESAVTVEPGDDCVSIMSMHKAKGLEFDVVVLADLARRFHGVGDVGSLVVDRLGESMGFRLGAGLRTVGYDDLAGREHANQLAEARRLLYVGCTRARRLLVLPLHWMKDDSRGSLQRVLLDTGIFADAGEVPFGQEQKGVFYPDTNVWAGELTVQSGRRSGSESADEDVASLLTQREEWLAGHAEIAERASVAEPFVLPSATEPEHGPSRPADEPAGGIGGKDFGSLFHNVMARLPLDRIEDGDLGPLVRGLAGIEADALGRGEDAAAEAVRLAEEALANADYRQALKTAESAAVEVTFAVPLAALPICADDAPGLLEGSIDLLLSGPAGSVILDYKTDRVGDGQRNAVAEGYWHQLALYALAARACGRAAGDVELALFFVRTGEIVRRRLDDSLLHALSERLARGRPG